MLYLLKPNISHKEQWEEIMTEWKDDWRKNPRIFFQDTYEIFLEKIDSLERANDDVNKISRSSCFFLQDSITERIVGMYWLRHNLDFWNDDSVGGNIGYGIRLSDRRKGYGGEGLGLVLREAKKIGLEKVFLVCDDSNIGSWKIIEKNAGVLEKKFEKEGVLCRRYWINLYKEEKNILVQLELELLSFDCRHNPDRIDALLADDFFECGKSGDRFGKGECLTSLPKESDGKKFEVSEMQVHMLSENIGQVRYLCTIENPGESRTTSFRTSLWRRGESGWQMFFHQGTLII